MTCVKETNMAREEPYTRRLHEVVKAIAQCFEDSVDVFVTSLSVSVRARWRYVWLVYGHGPDTHFPNAHQFWMCKARTCHDVVRRPHTA